MLTRCVQLDERRLRRRPSGPGICSDHSFLLSSRDGSSWWSGVSVGRDSRTDNLEQSLGTMETQRIGRHTEQYI